jgi:hypothetical protein
MTALSTTFAQLLMRLGACREAREWCGDRTAEQAWADAPRADWMIWLLRALGVADRWVSADLARLFCADAMETVGSPEWARLLRELPRVVDAETAATAEFWCGFARESSYAAAYAAYAAYAADAAAAAAYAAADAAAADAAYAAADAAAAYAADADAAAAYAAADAADAARTSCQKRLADMVRERVPFTVVAAGLP